MPNEPQKIFVKPAPGGKVRDDRTRKFLADEGELKPRTTYWLRRIRMGDVVVAEGAKAAPVPEPTAGDSFKEDEPSATTRSTKYKRTKKDEGE